MAPLYPRQIIHSLTPTPPHLPEDPPTSSASKSEHASPVVLGELFAVTFAIFVLAVLSWKIGRFFRQKFGAEETGVYNHGLDAERLNFPLQ